MIKLILRVIVLEMILTKLKNSVKQAVYISGYSRAAIDLQKLTDEQLTVAGLSRKLLERGYAAYPWCEESETQIADIGTGNVSILNTTSVNQISIMSQTTKAA